MAKHCIECGKKKGIFAYNYVGFVVQRDRKIEPHVLPGDRQRDFLCVECANKIKFVCEKHGEVKGRIRVGLPLFCEKCRPEVLPKKYERSAFTGIGSLIGVMIGGANFGIMGAIAGGVLGTILVSSGIDMEIKNLKTKGKFHPFTGAVVVSYILAFLFTSVAIVLAPLFVKNVLTSDTIKPGMVGLLVQYVGPAFAGGIGAMIPVWLSAGRKAK